MSKNNLWVTTIKEKTPIRIESIKVEWIKEEYPYLDWLETEVQDGEIVKSMRYTQEDLDSEPEETMKYIRQDQRRLREYGQYWVMMGCVAKATVSYPEDDRGNRRLEWLSSGGLWGIESDSEQSYKDNVEKGQLLELKRHLEVFGVDTSNFEEVNEE